MMFLKIMPGANHQSKGSFDDSGGWFQPNLFDLFASEATRIKPPNQPLLHMTSSDPDNKSAADLRPNNIFHSVICVYFVLCTLFFLVSTVLYTVFLDSFSPGLVW